MSHAVLAEPGFLTTEMTKEAGVSFGPKFERDFLFRATKVWFESLPAKSPDEHASSDYFLGQIAPYANLEYYCNGVITEVGAEHWRIGSQAMQSVMQSARPEAWLYLIIIYIFYGVPLTIYLKKHDPALLEERMKWSFDKNVKWWDKVITYAFVILFLVLFIIAPLDAVRYQWSQVPLLRKTFGFVGFIFCLIVTFLVMNENTFLARTVKIQKDRGQKVITTGPYSYVRHPMYVGFLVFCFCFPLALGSYYAVIPGTLIAIVLIIRTYLEDKTLHKELSGYKDYVKKTRYRLVPGVW